MKLRIEQHETGYLTAEAVPGEYDALPLLDSIRVDATTWTMHPDRAAAALCLLFHDSVSGGFHLPEPGCSPQTATAIANFFRPTACNVFPVNYVPSRIIGGEVDMAIIASEVGLSRVGGQGVSIRLEGDGIGAMASWEGLSISTNALLACREDATPLRAALPAIGVALLFCEDLFVGRINLPRSLIAVDDRAEHELAEKIRQLLDSVGLRLSWH